MADFDALLRLQGHDTTLAQLHHRRGHLPEHAESDEIRAAIAALTSETAATRAQHAELTMKMGAIEKQVHDLDAKIDGLNKQMFGDAARSPRELQAIEADIESVRRHRSTLEDEELALLESFEPLDAVVREADGRVAAHQARLAELAGLITESQATIDRDAAEQVSARAASAALVDPPTLALYEQVRGVNRGVGAARLEHGTCMSCRLKIAAVELDRIRHLPPDALVRCDECGAILVR